MNPKVYTQDQMDRVKESINNACFDYHCFVITSVEVVDIEFQVHGVDQSSQVRPPLPIASDIKRGES